MRMHVPAAIGLVLLLAAPAVCLVNEDSQPNGAGREVLEPLRYEARSCREVVLTIAGQVGKKASVDPELAESKVTLAVRTLSWSELQTQLADVLEAEWVSDKRGGQVLQPTARRREILRREREERVRQNQERVAKFRRGFQQLTSNDPYPGPPPEQVSPTSPEALRDVLRALPPALLETALQRPNPPFQGSMASKVPGVAVPVRSLPAPTQQALREHLTRLTEEWMRRAPDPKWDDYRRALPSRVQQFTLEIWCNEPKPQGGLTQLGLSLRDPQHSPQTMDIGFLSAPVFKQNGVPVASGKPSSGDVPPREPREQQVVRLPPGKFRYDRFVTRLAAATGIDIVADYYTRRLVSCDGAQKTVKEYLRQLKSELNVQATWSPGALRLTCRDWYEVADAEPTAEVTDLLEAAARDKAGPSFDAVLRIVSRSNNHQLATLERHTTAEGGKLPRNLASRIYGNGRWLRLFAALPASLRKTARSGAGLNLSRLPAATTDQWRQVALGRAFSPADPAQPLMLWSQDGPPVAISEWRRVPKLQLGAGRDRKNSIELWQEMISY